MKKDETVFNGRKNRRSFLKNGMVAAGAMTASVGLASRSTVFADEKDHAPITRGDIAILTFLSALEQVEADLWIQYAELGGPTPQVPSSFGLSPIDLEQDGKKIATGLAPAYITGLQVLDTDMPQYIADNTDDEISHHRFLNNYLASKGAKTIDLRPEFAILPPSRVTGVPQVGRLTNLKQLTVDTKWWTRYRSATQNPDFGGTFQNAVPDLAKGQHPAIPESDDDLTLDKNGNISTHLQAIANTAGFHFGFVEQGGSSLYPTLAQKVTNLEVLRILLSIGPSETMHFQVWHDKAGNAQVLTDGALSFPDLNSGKNPNGGGGTPQENADSFQTNLIMPEPTFFLSKGLGPVSIIRPTGEAGGGGAVAAVVGFVEDGLFIDPASGKNSPIVARLMTLAEAADDVRRGL